MKRSIRFIWAQPDAGWKKYNAIPEIYCLLAGYFFKFEVNFVGSRKKAYVLSGNYMLVLLL